MTHPTQPTERKPLPKAVLPTILIFFGLIVVVVIFANIWTEYAWYQALNVKRVFTIRYSVGLGLFLSFLVIGGGAIGGNMWLAYRLRPRTSAGSILNALDVVRNALQTRRTLTLSITSTVFGLFFGIRALVQIDTFLAWWHRTPFGINDPYFGKDISFFVFTYPWLTWLLGQLMLILVFSSIAALVVHIAMGSLRRAQGNTSVFSLKGEGPLTVDAQRHISVLLGIILLVFGLQQLIGRYGFAVDEGSLLTGITYTDDQTRVIANIVMAVIAFIVAALFIANAWIRKWSVPALGVVLMLVSSLILSTIYPLLVQQFDVRPDEPTKEAPYITEHLKATKHAFAIDNVEIEPYTAKTDVAPGQLKADAEALPGIRLMDPGLIGPTFEQMQQVRGYYSFPTTLDVDRYTINGEFTDAVVAIREMALEGVDDSWNNVHTVYTHGYGMVAAYGNRRQSNGLPVWIQGDIPPQGSLPKHEGRIYYGEKSTQFVIVGQPEGSSPWELDTPGGGEGGSEQYNTYDGKGGVPVGAFWKRVMFTVKYGDINILLSNRVNSESKILYNRTPGERVAKVAPWLTIDQDPFPAIVDGRTVWIVDGYTTSATYPNSQLVDLDKIRSNLTDENAVNINGQKINYIRNSVKATVDAYDGTVTLYAWDTSDPILQTWMKVYPGLVKDRSEIPEDLMSHLRYGQDYFKVQREVLGRYHTNSADTWYQKSDLWVVPDDPTPANRGLKELPYYLSIKWPGDEKPIFSNTAVYVPQGRDNLVAYLAVNADAASSEYGRLRVLKLSDSHQIDGPGQTFNAMTTDDNVAAKLLPFNTEGGARLQYGNLLTLPLGGGLMYVQPIYTMQQGSSGAYPVLRFVVVRFGTHVAIGDTLQDALDNVFRGDSGVTTDEGEIGSVPVDPGADIPPAVPTTQESLTKANEAFGRAEEALKNGDLAGYQEAVNEAEKYVQEAIDNYGS